MLLSAEIRLFHGVTWKAFQVPHTGEGGVVSFICVEIEASPWFPMPRLTTERVQPCLQRGQSKSQCPEFLLRVQAQPLGAHWWLLRGLSAHLGSLARVGCSSGGVHMAATAKGREQGSTLLGRRGRETERGLE